MAYVALMGVTAVLIIAAILWMAYDEKHSSLAD